MGKDMVLISSCLLGVRCRYDAKIVEPNLVALRIFEQGCALVLCPEVLGGLSCPRQPAEIQMDGRIVTEEGEDVTASFEKGAMKVLSACQALGVKRAYLKDKSPSCGSSKIYDGDFKRKLIPGQGACSALLREHGIEVLNEEGLERISTDF